MSAPNWLRSWRADPRGAALADRHYNRRTPMSHVQGSFLESAR